MHVYMRADLHYWYTLLCVRTPALLVSMAICGYTCTIGIHVYMRVHLHYWHTCLYAGRPAVFVSMFLCGQACTICIHVYMRTGLQYLYNIYVYMRVGLHYWYPCLYMGRTTPVRCFFSVHIIAFTELFPCGTLWQRMYTTLHLYYIKTLYVKTNDSSFVNSDCCSWFLKCLCINMEMAGGNERRLNQLELLAECRMDPALMCFWFTVHSYYIG